MLGLNEARCPAVCEGFVPHREKPRSLDNRSLKNRRAGWFLKNMKHSTYETSFVSGDHWIIIPLPFRWFFKQRNQPDGPMVHSKETHLNAARMGTKSQMCPSNGLAKFHGRKKKTKLLADDTSAWIWLSKQVFTERPPFLKLSHIISCKTSKYYPNSWQSPTVQVVMPFGSCLKTLK